MKTFDARFLAAVVFAVLTSAVNAARAEPPFAFRDAGQDAGLFPALEGVRGHGAAWGDIDGDGQLDLYVGAFGGAKYKPNQLFRNSAGEFQRDDDAALRIEARTTGVVFADLDNDGDLDLYVGNMPADSDSKLAARLGSSMAPCSLFRNDGQGRFTDISEGNGACPPAFGGRSVAVLDFDGDGLLDLLVGEDPLSGYNGSPTRSSRLFRNEGDLQFADVSREAGLPEGIPGYGAAAADVNNDGWPDFFLAANDGGNRLFLNNGRGKFREAEGARETFAWSEAGGDNMVCGVCFGDVNRDGLLDVLIGQHFKQPWLTPVANRLYLNRGVEDGAPAFEDITERIGLSPLPLKAPHVEIQDFDNDGWPDIYASLVKFDDDGNPSPLIFQHLGVRDGLPRFREHTLAVNDFPTSEDRAIKSTGAFFEKMIEEKKIIYSAPGPSGDYDNDGRLDLFLPNWWAESPSLLLQNETSAGAWLQVRVEGGDGVNRMGVGARVSLYEAGELGQSDALIGCREIAVGYGYASGQPAIAHFGLGDRESVDVEVILPHGNGKLAKRGVGANRQITIK